MSKDSVLALLMAGSGYLSGEEMSARLGISRAAVWKSIKLLREEGYGIEAKTNRGYRLVSSPDILTAEAIRAHLTEPGFCREIICLDEVDSTSSYLKRLAASGGRHGTVAVAESQTGGRGRLGRRFVSPRGKGVFLSILLRPQVPPPETTVLTSFAAVAVCEAVAAASGVSPGIKWVNDIVAGDKKICGILTEMAVESETQQVDYIVIGAGVNVHHGPEDFPPDIRPRAASLSMLSAEPVSRARLAGEMISALGRMYSRAFVEPGPYLDRYRALCTSIDREILVIRGEERRPAYAVGIGDDCSLLVRYDDGSREALQYGEISIRGRDGYV